MRLAQLARKLGITQSEIVKILSNLGHDVIENGNTKLKAEEVDSIKRHTGYVEPEVEPSIDEVPVETKASDQAPEELIEIAHEVNENEEPETVEEPEELDEPEESSTQEETPVEVIRAKKVKLDGIKVIGKIDLPEPDAKKKEETVTEKPKKKKQTKSESGRRSKNRKGTSRGQLSYEEKIKLEKEKEEKAKKRKQKKLREKKKQHYYQNVQPKVAANPTKKRKKKKRMTEPSAPQKAKPQYRNPFKKFWGWLNGEYDRF